MLPGTTIAGRFQIEEQIGQGAAGTVFRALDRQTGERVAVKIVQAADDAHGARFLREAQLLAQLRHPGLVRYVGHGVIARGDRYLAMEWLEGEDLRSRLERGELSIQESVALVRRVAEVLSVVHGAGLLHRDIKPGNIFLCGGMVDRVKVIDFGLARSLAAANALTLTGMAVGTPAYMAPEQARGARDLDARADLFSLGCVLYKCLTGRPPFEGSHAVEVMTKVLLEEPVRVRDLRPGVPAPLADLVHHLLEKEPDRRPRSAREVVTALDGIDTSPDDRVPTPAPASTSSSRGITAGERRVLSVLLVAAEQGSADDLGPSPMMEQPVLEHGGRLSRLVDGTRVVTLEGAATPTDQAESAARCALSLRALLPATPMALATGSTEMSGRLPVGGVIERAAAMLDGSVAAATAAARDHRAPPSWIAIDEETAALVDVRFEVRPTGAGLGLVRTREVGLGSRTLLGKQTSLVGRDWELSGIGQLFQECIDGPSASAVVVTAPAGLGKSRLAHELLGVFRSIEPRVEIWIGRGEPARARSALGLLGQALRGAAGIRDGEPLETQWQKVSERVARHAPRVLAPRWADFLGELVGAPPPDDASPALRAARADPRVMSEQMSRAWEGFLNAEASAHPVVLVLEDLHWGDLSTVRFVDATLGSLEQRPWMVLALGRPELQTVFPDLWQRRNVQVFRLAPLAQKASIALVRQVLGAPADTATCERIASLAAGNAFYLEELIRSVAQGKAEGGAALPETVLAMVQARLAGLDPEPRRVLRAASIFGDAFWPEGVTALLGGSISWSLAPWLDALTAQEILVRRPESRFEGEPELAFRHTLLREGAYAMLTEEDRTLGHRLAAEWLERRGERDPAVLAEHFERGGRPERARVYYLRAAQQALRGSDTDAAMAMARRGLDGGAADDEVRVALLALLCEAHAWRDEWDTAARYGQEVMGLEAPGSAPWATGVRAKLGEALQQDDLRGFLALVHTLESVDPTPEAASAVVLALATATFILDWNCRFADAAARCARMTTIVRTVAPDDAMARGWLNMSLGIRHALATGEPWTGLARAEEALAAFTEANHSRGVLLARFAIGGNAWALGALDRAERELTATLVADEEFALGSSLRAVFLCNVLADKGNLDEARKGPVRLVERARARSSPRYEGQARIALAGVLLRAGDLDAAEAEVLAALDLPQLMPLDRMHGTALSAAVFLASGRAAKALSAAEQGLALYLKHDGQGPRHAFARLVHAEALHATGDTERAKRALAEARSVLLARAAAVVDPGLRASFLERVPENTRTLALAEEWLGRGDQPSAP